MRNQNTKRTRYFGYDGLIRYIESLTENASLNSDYESHIHTDEVEIYHFAEGSLFFLFEGRKIEIEEGSTVIITNNSHHRPIIKSPCRYSRRHILINRSAFSGFNEKGNELYKRISEKRILVIPKSTVLAEGFDRTFIRIKDYLLLGGEYDELCAMVNAISLLIRSLELCEGRCEPHYYSYGKRAAEIMKYISENLAEDLSYKSLSKRFYISEKSLYKFFKKEAGITLSEYILERRITKAQEILGAGGTAKEASVLAGFSNYSVFYRSFKKSLGITPIQYAKEHPCPYSQN